MKLVNNTKSRFSSTAPFFKRNQFVLVGAGVTATSLGFMIVYAASNDEEENKKVKKKIVVLGSGWGAVNFLKSLTPGEYEVSVISPENYFLFTPLLPSVTVGTVEGRSIIEPIRKILAKRHKHGAKFYEANCIDIDVTQNKVNCRDLSGLFSFTNIS